MNWLCHSPRNDQPTNPLESVLCFATDNISHKKSQDASCFLRNIALIQTLCFQTQSIANLALLAFFYQSWRAKQATNGITRWHTNKGDNNCSIRKWQHWHEKKTPLEILWTADQWTLKLQTIQKKWGMREVISLETSWSKKHKGCERPLYSSPNTFTLPIQQCAKGFLQRRFTSSPTAITFNSSPSIFLPISHSLPSKIIFFELENI